MPAGRRLVAASFRLVSECGQPTSRLRIKIRQLDCKVAERCRAVPLDDAVDGESAESINELCLRRGRPIDELPATSLPLQHALLVKAAHHRHDRRVGVLPALRAAQILEDIRNARLPARRNLANDRGGERTKDVFKVRCSGHAPHLPGWSLTTTRVPLLQTRSVSFHSVGALLEVDLLPILEGFALIGVSLGLIAASVAGRRSRQPESRVAQVFWRDVSQAGYVWSGATMVVLFGGLGEMQGLRAPIWLSLAIVAGLVGLVITRIRWGRHGAASGRPSLDDQSRPDRLRLVSTSWKAAVVGAGAGGLLAFGASVAQAPGYTIHWLVAAIGLAIGYALGLVMVTPRYTVKRGTP